MDRIVTAWSSPPKEAKNPLLGLRQARKSMGLSQNRFATIFGMSLSDVRNYEKSGIVTDPVRRTLLTVIVKDPDFVVRTLDIPKTQRQKQKK